MTPILELRGITKRFPGVLANDHINLTLEKGQIHALLGENGAGKTTLMNILYGLYQPDEGEIFINGQKVTIHSPADAIAQGIGMVHQHFMLIPVFTVTENVMLGEESTRFDGFLDRDQAAARVRTISEQYGLAVDPYAYVKDLPVGVQQRVEIIKLLYRKADILILDEPPRCSLHKRWRNSLISCAPWWSRGSPSSSFLTNCVRYWNCRPDHGHSARARSWQRPP